MSPVNLPRAATAALFLFVAQVAMAQDSGPKPQVATVETALTQTVSAEVSVTGTLVPREEVLVLPQVSGFKVTEVLVDEGDIVTEGQVLARIEDATIRAQLAQTEAEARRVEASVRQAENQIGSAQAALTQAQAALERVKALHQSGNASDAALDNATAAEAAASAGAASAADGLEVARAAQAANAAALDIARMNLANTEIKAPVSGLISQRNVQLGGTAAAAGQPAFTIIRDNAIELRAEAIETELGRISVGDAVRVNVAGIGEVSGIVRTIAPTVDPTTRLGTLRITLNNAPGLRIGLFASADIITDTHDGVTVSASAVISDQSGAHVQVVTDGVVNARDVDAGLLWQGRREIVSGLEAGEVVVTRAGAFFRDGDAIEPVMAAEAAQ